jgi:hypothetical protein
MQALTAAPYLCHPELDSSEFVDMFNKLDLQSDCNLAGIIALVPEKFDDHSLIILHPKRIVNEF